MKAEPECPRHHPRLSSENEARLVENDLDRERSYEQIEIVTEQMREVADALEAEDDEAIPIVVEAEDEPSLVTSIEGVLAVVR